LGVKKFRGEWHFYRRETDHETPVIDGMVIRLASSGPQIQIRLVAEEYASKSLIDRPDQAVSDDRDNHDKETITT
jgi:hypothetical protein